MDQTSHSILIGNRQSSMLEQSPPIFIRHTIAVLDIEGNYTSFVGIGKFFAIEKWDHLLDNVPWALSFGC